MDQEYDDHILAIQQFVCSSLQNVDKLIVEPTKPLTPLTDFCDKILNLQEEEQIVIQDLKEKIRDHQSKHENFKHSLVLLEKRKESLKKEKENVVEQKALKKKQLKRIVKEHETHKFTVATLKKHVSKDSESQIILDRNRKELLLYKQLTGIAWDFYAPDHLVKGYVSNKANSYLKPFCFDKNKMSHSQIKEALWEAINQSSPNINH